MPQPSYALVDLADQWLRGSLRGTAVGEGGALSLDWTRPAEASSAADAALPTAAGLAVDRWRSMIGSDPRAGRLWTASVAAAALEEHQEDCLGTGPLRGPQGLAIDLAAERLYVAEADAGRVQVIDLAENRTLRRISVRARTHRYRRPVDVAIGCEDVWVLTQRPAGLVRLRGRRGPLTAPKLERPAEVPAWWTPRRLDVACGEILVLWRGRRSTAVVARVDGKVAVSGLRAGTDLAFTDGGNTLVVAGGPDQPFRRFVVTDDFREIQPLDAPGYDGRGIAVSPDGEIAYRTAYGLRWALDSAAEYNRTGRFVTYRLAAAEYHNRWGRLFLDACIPPGTSVRVGFVSTDEDDPDDAGGPGDPGGDRGRVDLGRVAVHAVPAHLYERLGPLRPVYRRGASELAYQRANPASSAVSYEAPVDSPPGRYLWVVLELQGTLRLSPRIEALRVEHRAHPLTGLLPSAWSRSDADADVLHRFLAPLAGLVTDYDLAGELRHALLDPRSAPAETLDWLARFVGLVLDERWPEPARRMVIAEASRLFRWRGTLGATERFLEIYLGYRAPILERWRLRGIGGGLLGSPPTSDTAPLLGKGVRMGGTLGQLQLGDSGPTRVGDASAYDTHAHRFVVLVPAELTDEQRRIVRLLLDTHRPAHTTYDLCELGSGMRAGRRLHVGLTAVVGPPARWERVIVERTELASAGLVGSPRAGARLDLTSTVGGTRVA